MTNDVLILDDKNEKLLKKAFIFSIISVASAFLILGIAGIVFAILALVSCKKVKKAGVTEHNYAKLTYTEVLTIIGFAISAYSIITTAIISVIAIIVLLAFIIIFPFIIILSGLSSIGTLLLPFLGPLFEKLIMMILTGLAEAVIDSIMSEIGLATFLMLI